MSSTCRPIAHRASLLHLLGDPASPGAVAFWEDGLLWVEEGRIKAVGPARELLPLPESVELREHPHHLIIPGLIDAHVHYPQTGMIASHGEQLLDWLNTYTFPTEAAFGDPVHARRVAETFLDELLRNGTTTAAVFCTVHPESVDAFFRAAQARGLCMAAGKVLMDRHAPEGLLDTAGQGEEESRQLMERWRGVDRLRYAITPRFAPTSTVEQLASAGRLLREEPGCLMQTHLSENLGEMAWVRALFPEALDYLDVYDRAGLLGERSLLAHGIHLGDRELDRLAETGASIVHCPSSNLFLGSGLMDWPRLRAHGVRVALGTDVGAGTSFSLLRTMGEAYKVQQLRGHSLDPFQSFHAATLGAAEALGLAHRLGNLQPGKDADFVLLDLEATPLLAFRRRSCRGGRELLFLLQTLGDDRLVQETYALGACRFQRSGECRGRARASDGDRG
nr:guanine deaminase [uncultured Holophaga sp.]